MEDRATPRLLSAQAFSRLRSAEPIRPRRLASGTPEDGSDVNPSDSWVRKKYARRAGNMTAASPDIDEGKTLREGLCPKALARSGDRPAYGFGNVDRRPRPNLCRSGNVAEYRAQVLWMIQVLCAQSVIDLARTSSDCYSRGLRFAPDHPREREAGESA